MTSFLGWLTPEGLTDTVDIISVSPAQFRCSPQQGTPLRLSWQDFADMLSTPKIADAKDGFGGFACGLYAENIRRKTNFISSAILAIDNDGNAPVDRIAQAMSKTRSIVLETFSSTPEDPRCRLLIKLREPVDLQTYKAIHAVMREKIRTCTGAAVDEGAKDGPRLSYWPVRRPGDPYAFAQTFGRELDAQRVLALQPKKAEPPREAVEPPKHADLYLEAALRKAAANVANAPKGARHETVNAEAYSLARLPLTKRQIVDALLPSAIAAMGKAREAEAERTINDAIDARGAA